MEQLGIGVVGLNYGAALARREIVEGPGARYFRLEAVCDTDRRKADEHAARLGVAACHDLDDLLARDAVRVVGLFTNPNGRAELIRTIIRAGRDVMTTKPFELDPRAARDVLEEAAGLKRTVLLNSPAPVLPEDMAFVRHKIQEYGLGRPVGCRGDIWGGYRDRPADGTRWFSDPALCPVAPIMRLGIYLINDILLFFDEPRVVQILTARTGITRFGVPDNAQGTILFGDGSLASVFASLGVHDGSRGSSSLVMNFERGTVRWSTAAGEPLRVSLAFDRGNGAETEEARFGHDVHAYRWDVLYACARGEWSGEITRAEKIVQGVKVLEAFGRAERSQRAEELRE